MLVQHDEYDRVKGDSTTLTTVVVEKTDRGFNRLACKGGVLKNLYDRTYLNPLADATVELVGLQEEFINWKNEQIISLAAAAKLKSVAPTARIRLIARAHVIRIDVFANKRD